MNTANEEFLFVYAELEYQIKRVMNEPDKAPHLPPGEAPSEPKVLGNYESAMRAHAAGCEAGR